MILMFHHMVQLLLCVCDVQMKLEAWLRGHTLTAVCVACQPLTRITSYGANSSTTAAMKISTGGEKLSNA